MAASERVEGPAHTAQLLLAFLRALCPAQQGAAHVALQHPRERDAHRLALLDARNPRVEAPHEILVEHVRQSAPLGREAV